MSMCARMHTEGRVAIGQGASLTLSICTLQKVLSSPDVRDHFENTYRTVVLVFSIAGSLPQGFLALPCALAPA